jgi:hypothetical protein
MSLYPKSPTGGYSSKDCYLELVAPVAPLKTVLTVYMERNNCGWDGWAEVEELESWDGYDELGTFAVGEADMPISLSKTKMMLIAEKAETANIQAILIQPSSKPNEYKRVGHFIHKTTEMERTEEDDYPDFVPLRSLFTNVKIRLI